MFIITSSHKWQQIGEEIMTQAAVGCLVSISISSENRYKDASRFDGFAISGPNVTYLRNVGGNILVAGAEESYSAC